jgi:hypothetical protein
MPCARLILPHARRAPDKPRRSAAILKSRASPFTCTNHLARRVLISEIQLKAKRALVCPALSAL